MRKKNNDKQFNFTRKPIFNIHHQADPLFTAKCHPSEPIFVTGTATGHVQTYRYNIDKLEEIYTDQDKFPYDISCVKYDDFDDDSIIVQWHTKRHKKSCRDLCFDLPSNGNLIYSIGSEGIIKTADINTGQVISKFNSIKDNNYNFKINAFTKCLSTPNKNFLIVGDENGNLICNDTRDKHLKIIYKPFQKLHLGEGINSINYCWPKSDYKIITTGSTTICELDLRKSDKPLNTSEDQEDEILCSSWLDQEKQETMICGMGDGIITTWKPEINKWEDQISRIRIVKNETVESLISAMDSESRFMYGGCSNGHIAKIDIKGGKVIERFLQHDPEEDDKIDEVLGLDLDYNYRLVSFGTEGFKIWENESNNQDNEEEEEEEEKEEEENSQDDDDDGYSDINSLDNELKVYKEDSSSEDPEERFEKDLDELDEIELEKIKSRENNTIKRSLTDSLKRRMDVFTSNEIANKKNKVSEEQNQIHELNEVEIGNEILDSDDETDFTKGKVVELCQVKDQILAHIDNPELSKDNEKQSKKDKKKNKKNKNKNALQENGIRKFDGL